ncbi:hypothetical protein TSTA_040170 [Talaromyces stipitatus ATCC 10500]|uniref:Uncharacterized protein n=1 Tax=Talaromyces stipitatus (strain ATCC 10500 / CBS 375.48 / QM 6759 / NRRL 1006) TaxID=441959 RepID=B8M480_TALSN|nr:uncharacterized protein TSTA_040170 [Talaromyces stipitatus ATCC 10500]EED20823.1 hypothetical protein TSTA_040170 [Talaromyces stipitatus ATCC 10500]
MAEANIHYQKAGLPVVTPDEDEELTQALTSLADPDSLEEGALLADGADPSGGNQLETVYYVNFNPNTSAELKPQLEAVSANVNLNSNFFSVKADAAVAEKIPSGTQTKKANYKAKVINHLAQTAPWYVLDNAMQQNSISYLLYEYTLTYGPRIANVGLQTQKKNFKVEKNVFHDTLVKTFTHGLNLPETITAKLENFLQNVKNVIDKASDTSDSLTFFILITLYQQDDVAKIWRPYIRTIYFRVDQSLSEYTKKKGDKSSGKDVNVDFEYVQSDGQFNNALFESNAKTGINQLINAKSADFIKNTLFDVSVDD